MLHRRPRILAIPLLSALLLALSGAGGGGGDGCNPDDDGGYEPGLVVDPEGVLTTSESGLSATFTVALASPPTEPVTVLAASLDMGEWTVGEPDGDADLSNANTLELLEVLTLTYPHGPGGVDGDNGVHNQGYHFDGTWHYSVGTDSEHRGWLFVNHADGRLKCAEALDDPFVGPDPEATGKIHPGGGWFRGGRFYTVVANQKDLSPEGGGFGIVSFAPGACDAADDPDAMDCGCDTAWVEQPDGDPQLWTSDDYKGFGIDFGDEARIYDIYGSSDWTCSPTGEGCVDVDGDGPSGGLTTCLIGDHFCPQECAVAGDHVVCTPFPARPPASLAVYPADPDAIGEFQEPARTIRLPRVLDLDGTPGMPNPEGIAMYDGRLYLAGDHADGDDGGCGFATPCTGGAGDQLVRVHELVQFRQEIVIAPEDWSQEREVTVTGVDDLDLDGDRAGFIGLNTHSDDPDYDGLIGLVAAINVDDDAAAGPLQPTSLSPPHGSEHGGQPVQLEGTGLFGTSEVWFGDVPATLGDAFEVAVELESPPGPAGSTVDVRVVRADGEEVTLPGAWTWHADHAGLYTGLSRSLMVAYDPARFWIGSPYGDISPPYVQLDGLFHEPIARSSTLFGASAFPGDCGDPGGASWTTVPAGPSLWLHADPVGTVDVPDGGGDGVYRLLFNDVSVWDWSAERLDLEILGGDGPPAQRIDGAVVMPEVPDFGGVSWSAGNSWTWGDDFELAWSTVGPAPDAVTWTMMPAAGVSPLASFGCTMQGEGPLVVPWADIVDGVDTGQLNALIVKLGFWSDAEPTMEHDGSTFWGRGFVDLYFWFGL